MPDGPRKNRPHNPDKPPFSIDGLDFLQRHQALPRTQARFLRILNPTVTAETIANTLRIDIETCADFLVPINLSHVPTLQEIAGTIPQEMNEEPIMLRVHYLRGLTKMAINASQMAHALRVDESEIDPAWLINKENTTHADLLGNLQETTSLLQFSSLPNRLKAVIIRGAAAHAISYEDIGVILGFKDNRATKVKVLFKNIHTIRGEISELDRNEIVDIIAALWKINFGNIGDIARQLQPLYLDITSNKTKYYLELAKKKYPEEIHWEKNPADGQAAKRDALIYELRQKIIEQMFPGITHLSQEQMTEVHIEVIKRLEAEGYGTKTRSQIADAVSNLLARTQRPSRNRAALHIPATDLPVLAQTVSDVPVDDIPEENVELDIAAATSQAAIIMLHHSASKEELQQMLGFSNKEVEFLLQFMLDNELAEIYEADGQKNWKLRIEALIPPDPIFSEVLLDEATRLGTSDSKEILARINFSQGAVIFILYESDNLWDVRKTTYLPPNPSGVDYFFAVDSFEQLAIVLQARRQELVERISDIRVAELLEILKEGAPQNGAQFRRELAETKRVHADSISSTVKEWSIINTLTNSPLRFAINMSLEGAVSLSLNGRITKNQSLEKLLGQILK